MTDKYEIKTYGRYHIAFEDNTQVWLKRVDGKYIVDEINDLLNEDQVNSMLEVIREQEALITKVEGPHDG